MSEPAPETSFRPPVSTPQVVITDSDYGDLEIERKILARVSAEVVSLQAKAEGELLDAVRGCDAVICQYAHVGAAAIAGMERCRVIARYGTGVDIVDVEAASAKGVLVTNVPDYCTEEVADHAIALWLALVRKLIPYNRATHAGVWHWQSGQPVDRLSGRCMGIVSFGRIGRAIARRAQAFGVEVIACDPFVDDALARSHNVRLVSKNELLETADYVVMQVPMTGETRHFLGEPEFRRMRPGAFVINTGRGPTIDNAALYRALREGRLGGAALDDPEEEPAKRRYWQPSDNPIFSLPDVIVTPHAAYYSEQSLRLARETAAAEVVRVLRGHPPRYPVNAAALRSYRATQT